MLDRVSIWVGIVGVGQTKFGSLPDSSARELVADAFKEQAPYILGLGQLSEGLEDLCLDRQEDPRGPNHDRNEIAIEIIQNGRRELDTFPDQTEHHLELAT